MSVKLQAVLTIIWLMLLVFFIHQIRKKAVSVKHSLTWLVFVLVMIVLTLVPDLLELLCNLMGIETPSNMLFFFGFILVLIVLYAQTVALSRMSERKNELTQQVALMEYEYKRIINSLYIDDLKNFD